LRSYESECADSLSPFPWVNDRMVDCNWVESHSDVACIAGVSQNYCPKACGLCDGLSSDPRYSSSPLRSYESECADSLTPFPWVNDRMVDCGWIARHSDVACMVRISRDYCPNACGLCSGS
jgi:hypothetical protein